MSEKNKSKFLFIFWAGGTALLSYSLVYALRKPYTAAAFANYEVFGMDYKVVVTIAQIIGYTISKFIGIKLISEMYQSFEKHLFSSLRDFTDPIPGVLEVINNLRLRGIKIGSTTGYTMKMMDVVRPEAKSKGYMVDNLVTPDNLPAGRPAPYMIYQNMIDLGIASVNQVIKVGDTIADIKEGVNANVHSVGIVVGSNEMGLTEKEYNQLSVSERGNRIEEVRNRMLEAGANAVLTTIAELPAYIDLLSKKENENTMRNYLLLTPGPLSTTQTVKEAMLQDWCTWDKDYNEGIVTPIRQQLLKLANVNNK
ncbi:phosphonoacetaldehyde hydrolase [Dysgonomonadaceae bacterium PH5-43]|nr:phosphonoacetaldehyde hydrolase [Dysgonomonadaceae bacterium PH5-43]